MEKDIKNLTKVEWKIYNFLKEQTLNDKWSSQQEIINFLEKQGIKICTRQLRKNIQNIRKCENITKIILTDYSKGYRIMSDEEEYKILLNRKICILKQLKQYWKDVRNLEKNGQMKITFDTKERNFIESLLK